jgi:hypothetical protein
VTGNRKVRIRNILLTLFITSSFMVGQILAGYEAATLDQFLSGASDANRTLG